MEKIILFYRFTPLADPTAVRLWQQNLCSSLGLKGRIIISPQGINGTLGGSLSSLKKYVQAYKTYEPFHDTHFKWSDGAVADFPKLSIKVRAEMVTFNAEAELHVNEDGVVGRGTSLTPAALHTLVAERGDEVTFFDGRSSYEAAIGKFKNAVVPNVQTAKDFIKEIEKPEYAGLKKKPIVTYCTGGIRCEILSTLMKNRGFEEVYQLDGGIVTYGQEYGDDGLWEGSLYVFDKRMAVNFSDHSKAIGHCIHCDRSTSNYENCANATCNDLMLVCDICREITICPKCQASVLTY
jgi:UPF0176 protein